MNGKRDVVFDARPALNVLDAELVGSMPLAPPFRPYFVTYFTPTPSPSGASTTVGNYWELPVDAVLVATTAAAPVFTTTLEHATYNPATKTCSNVGCHVGRQSLVDAAIVGPLRWGTPYDGFGSTTCTGCHRY